MTALSVDTAKNIAIAVVLGFLVFAVVSAWLIKNIFGKLIMVVVMGGLALGAWTQRTSLQDCADKAQAAVTTSGSVTTVKCKFFGNEVSL